MKRAAILISLACCAAAGAAPIVVMPAGGSAANVATQNAANAAGAARYGGLSACYWQVPGEMRWLNVQALAITIGPDGSWGDKKFVLTIDYGYKREYTHKIPQSTDIAKLADSIFARIRACARGE